VTGVPEACASRLVRHFKPGLLGITAHIDFAEPRIRKGSQDPAFTGCPLSRAHILGIVSDLAQSDEPYVLLLAPLVNRTKKSGLAKVTTIPLIGLVGGV
jgi:hypothetical protein